MIDQLGSEDADVLDRLSAPAHRRRAGRRPRRAAPAAADRLLDANAREHYRLWRTHQARGRRLRHPQRAASEAALLAYMPERWRAARRGRPAGRRDRGPARDARRPLLPRRGVPARDPACGAHRRMAAEGRPPASDLPFMREQLLDRYDIEYGVLTPMLGAGEQLDLERGAALACAINDWQVAEWLEPEPRLRASINVAYEDGELAAREIHRHGRRSSVRAGAHAHPHRRAARAAQVLADLRRGGRARAAGRDPLRRLGPRADHRRRVRRATTSRTRSGWPPRSRTS